MKTMGTKEIAKALQRLADEEITTQGVEQQQRQNELRRLWEIGMAIIKTENPEKFEGSSLLRIECLSRKVPGFPEGARLWLFYESNEHLGIERISIVRGQEQLTEETLYSLYLDPQKMWDSRRGRDVTTTEIIRVSSLFDYIAEALKEG